jgi:hypothetical protein
MKITKKYARPFVAEESKVTRLLAVIEQKFAERNTEVHKRFEAHLSGGKIYETANLSDVFRLDNSSRNRVTRLVINCTSTNKEHEVRVDFDGRFPVDVTLNVLSTDYRWTSDVTSVAEEQVERTLQSSFWCRMRGSRQSIFLLPILFGLMVSGAVSLFDPHSSDTLSRSMWLTHDDIVAFDNTLATAKHLTPEQVAEVVTRQLANLARVQQRGAFPVPFTDWRLLLIILPGAAAIVTFVYLIACCYPMAVFSWGDVEQWYQDLVTRRKTIWSVLIGSLAVGILANLFVFGLSGFLHP